MQYSTAKKIRRVGAAAVLGGAALIGASLYKGGTPEALAAGGALAAAGAAMRSYARKSYERDPSNWGWAPQFGMNYYDINRLGAAAVLGGVGVVGSALAAGQYVPEASAVGTALVGSGIAAFARGAQLRKQRERSVDAAIDLMSFAMKRQKAWREHEEQAGESQ